MPTPRSKPAQKPEQKSEPEIHLHGDIIVHTHQDGSAKANYDEFNAHVSEHQLLQAKVNAEREFLDEHPDLKVGKAPINQESSPRMRFDVALEQLSTACDFLEDRINLLYLRTEPLRIQGQDSMPGAGPSGFANDESSNMMQMMNSIWHRVMIAGNRIDTVCSELET